MASTAVAMARYKPRQDEELCADQEEALLGCPTGVPTEGVVIKEEEDEALEEATADDGAHEPFCACCRGLITARLPQELLIEIFSLLPVRVVCLQAALTCRAWCSLTLDQALWQRLFAKHFEEELEDKANRFYHLRLRQELKWRQEFQHCVSSSSRDIKVYLRQQGTQRSEMAEVVVNVRDSMRKLLKKASRAFNIAVPQKLIFSFIEAPSAQDSRQSDVRDDFELSYQRWLELEAHEERVIRSHQLPFAPASVGLEEINHVRRLFRHERRQQRQARLKYHQAMETRRHQRHTMAVVVVEDGDGPHQRVENNRLNPPIVTYYINSLGPKDERVGHFLIDGCVGTCLLSRQFLIDM